MLSTCRTGCQTTHQLPTPLTLVICPDRIIFDSVSASLSLQAKLQRLSTPQCHLSCQEELLSAYKPVPLQGTADSTFLSCSNRESRSTTRRKSQSSPVETLIQTLSANGNCTLNMPFPALQLGHSESLAHFCCRECTFLQQQTYHSDSQSAAASL